MLNDIVQKLMKIFKILDLLKSAKKRIYYQSLLKSDSQSEVAV